MYTIYIIVKNERVFYMILSVENLKNSFRKN